MSTATDTAASTKPKLRSSCDACGAAKLKCNRVHPECKRCADMGLTCVYGVSRKMGKPPRYKKALSNPISEQFSGPGTSIFRSKEETAHNRTSRPTHERSISPRDTSRHDSILDTDAMSMAWSTTTPHQNNHQKDSVQPQKLTYDTFGAADMTFDEFCNDQMSQFRASSDFGSTVHSLGSPDFESLTASLEIDPRLGNGDGTMFLDENSMGNNVKPDHDCFGEAYSILGRLSFPFDSHRNSTAGARMSPASPAPNLTTDIPLDQILHLTREATQRLSRLLTCTCAQNPHLVFTSASAISRILLWYQQAAACVNSGSLCTDFSSFANNQADDFFTPASSSSDSPTPWSSISGTANSGTPPACVGGVTPMVMPLKLSLGTFSIDDGHMETALTAQLLLSELKRTSVVIELLGMQQSNSYRGPSAFAADGGFGMVHKNLNTWLSRLHARVVEDIRALLQRSMAWNVHRESSTKI